MRRRRDATKVIYEILSLVASGAGKTQIVYQVNLNFRLANRYIGFLKGKQLIQGSEDGAMTLYVLTEKGNRFLASLSEVEQELSELFPTIQRSVPSVRVHSLRIPSINDQSTSG